LTDLLIDTRNVKINSNELHVCIMSYKADRPTRHIDRKQPLCADRPSSSIDSNLFLEYHSILLREAWSAVLQRQVVRLSVRPSVTSSYRGHIDWISAKIISRLISLTFSLSADPNMTDLL